MKFIKPIFYIAVAILLLTIISMVYIQDDAAGTGANVGLTVTYILLIVISALALIFPIREMIQNPAAGIRALIGVGAIGLVFLIGYAIAGSEITIVYQDNGITEASTSKFIGGALNLMFLTLAAIVGATIFSEVRNLLK